MSGKTLQYFTGGNTAQGYYDLLAANLVDVDNIFILHGLPEQQLSYMLQTIADKWAERNFSLELHHRAANPSQLDGFILPSLKVAIVDGTRQDILDSQQTNVTVEYVDCSTGVREDILTNQQTEISKLETGREAAFQSAYQSFVTGLAVHDVLEKIYIKEMDFKKADEVTNELMTALLGKERCEKKSTIRRRFLGAATPDGAIDFVPNITKGLDKRYFIKGRAGSGKSTMLKKIAQLAEQRGFDMEIYHCGFDPNSLDMVLVRELGWAIFDSTAPHEYGPDRNGDEVIDMYERTITPGTDEKYAREIETATKEYKSAMKKGTAYLKEAQTYQADIERIYQVAIDDATLEAIVAELDEEIEKRIG